MLDNKLDILLEALPLNDTIKTALLEHRGPFGELLTLEENYEQADWSNFKNQCQKLGLHIEDVNHALTEAQRWSTDVYQVMTTIA
jgi:EAL and modified HD-GYP domain-containing signal transduction protein